MHLETNEVPGWDQYYMEQLPKVAARSKDRSTKVACILVSNVDHGVLATGYNSFPRRIRDNVPERHERPIKYKWTEHAERNAIYLAAKRGTSLNNCRAYIPCLPCMDCARALVQIGCTEVMCNKLDKDDPLYVRWQEDFVLVSELFTEAGLRLKFYTPPDPKEKPYTEPY